MREIDLIVVHCSVSEFGDAALIDRWRRERGFRMNGYHYVILNGYSDSESLRERRPNFWMDGKIETGRDLDEPGAHVKYHNTNSIGICLIGKNCFTFQQFISLQRLLTELQAKFPAARLKGHYELLSKERRIKTCPNIDMNWLRGALYGNFSA